jgi:serine O-acetyltransferase
MIWEVTKIILNINCQISYMATIGSNIRLPHIAEGVIISPKAEIGNYVTIFHQVTIGINESLSEEKQAISIGDGCYISAGAKIISCKIGKNVKIGPNAVVYKNIEDNSRVFSENHYN